MCIIRNVINLITAHNYNSDNWHRHTKQPALDCRTTCNSVCSPRL